MSQDLAGQTVVVIGGTAGIGLETARRARAEGAELILTARNPERLSEVGRELGARTAAFDATDFDRLQRFFAELPGRSTTSSSPVPAPTTRRWRSSTSTRRAATSTPTCCCRCRSPGARAGGSTRGARCCSWAGPAAAARRRGSR